VDIQNDWKLINIFIGVNDACEYCKTKDTEWSAERYGKKMKEALRLLKKELPRSIVSVMAMLNLNVLRKVDMANPFCPKAHR